MSWPFSIFLDFLSLLLMFGCQAVEVLDSMVIGLNSWFCTILDSHTLTFEELSLLFGASLLFVFLNNIIKN